LRSYLQLTSWFASSNIPNPLVSSHRTEVSEFTESHSLPCHFFLLQSPEAFSFAQAARYCFGFGFGFSIHLNFCHNHGSFFTEFLHFIQMFRFSWPSYNWNQLPTPSRLTFGISLPFLADCITFIRHIDCLLKRYPLYNKTPLKHSPLSHQFSSAYHLRWKSWQVVTIAFLNIYLLHHNCQ